MDGIATWITPTLLVALFAWLRLDMREQRRESREEMRALSARLDQVNMRFDEMNARFDQRFDEMNKRFDQRFDDVNTRFDQLQRELADLRERMAKLEGSLEGFLAGRRDRAAA